MPTTTRRTTQKSSSVLGLDPASSRGLSWDRAGVARRRSQRAGASGIGAGQPRRGAPAADPRAAARSGWSMRRSIALVDRRRVRQALGMPSDRRISNEVIDELLAGASDGGGDRRAWRGAGAADQAAGRAGDGGRADRARRLRAALRAARRRRQPAQRHDAQDADHRAREGRDRRAPRPRRQASSRRSSRSASAGSSGSTRRSSRSTRRGLSTRDIEAHLEEIYGVKVGRDLISRVTDAVMDDVREWAKRPLEDIYPIVFLDCMVLKIREGGTVQRRALLPRPRRHARGRARRARHVVPGDRGRQVLDAGALTSSSSAASGTS